jgi:carbon monoxide dehydrogenase subunit G
MDMTGEQRIPASREIVWQALNDPEVLKACIPGCQELTKQSDTDMTALAVIKVGPISAKFAGAVTLSDLNPPNGYKITGEGRGGVAGHVKGGAIVRLEQDGGDTILFYDVNAQIGGKLAQLGSRMIDATARSMSAAFFKSLSQQIETRYLGVPASSGGPAAQSSAAAEPLRASAQQPPVEPARKRRAAVEALRGKEPEGASSFGMLKPLSIVMLAALLIGAWWLLGRAGQDKPASGVSPDFAMGVQLLFTLAIGYLLGRQQPRQLVLIDSALLPDVLGRQGGAAD